MSPWNHHVPKTNIRATLNKVSHPVRVEADREINCGNARDAAGELATIEAKRRARASHGSFDSPAAIARREVHGFDILGQYIGSADMIPSHRDDVFDLLALKDD
jgi:hypothetical protein